MSLVVQRPSEIHDMGDSIVHPKYISRDTYKKIIAQNTVTDDHARLHAIVEYVDPIFQSN
jgi:hypothetical protein